MRPVRSTSASCSVISSEHSTGTSVTATNSDISSENTTTTDNCLNSTLEKPVRKNSGTNTAMWVRVEARMALQISSLPSIDACLRDLPISR